MSKRIAFCADGTWDTSTKHTNVYKLYKALNTTADQMPLYDDGVGADGLSVVKLIGGAFGTGLWQKIKDGYTKIAHIYEHGDEVYLFGFSRGAYTARSLAGMIAACGLPTSNFTNDLVETAFDAYRNKDERQDILAKLKNNNMEPPTIKMVGVWDTVGSLGIPSAIGAVDPVFYGFLDTGLHPCIQHAYHALALNEKRGQFPATLWKDPAPGQTLEQVWFCGVHSDVGGGEPDDVAGATALSDITLAWMMSKASALGLDFDDTVQKQYQLPLTPEYALDTLHPSWTVLNGFPIERKVDTKAAISNSVVLRCQHDNSFRPSNLTFNNGVLATDYSIVTVVGEPQAAGVAAAQAARGGD
jgi:uncharacterized protein (DUF2235 family)